MQDTFARATHSAKRARDDRVSCIQKVDLFWTVFAAENMPCLLIQDSNTLTSHALGIAAAWTECARVSKGIWHTKNMRILTNSDNANSHLYET